MQKVRLIYLVPADSYPRKECINAMTEAIQHLQWWYSEQMEGKTFTLNDPVVEIVSTNHPAKWYAQNPAGEYYLWFWNNVLADGFTLTDAKFNDPNFVWVFYIDAENDPEQYGGAGTNNIAVLPQHDLCGLIGESDRPISRWIGGLGHELGHAFGLPHPPECEENPDCPECQSLMYFGFYNYPETFLLSEDQEILNQSPFFTN